MKKDFEMNKSKVKMGKPSTPQHSTGNGSRSTPPSRNKSDKDIPYEGIYQNLRFCETITSLMGNTVQIQLSNGKIFEGIFSTFSPQLEVVLELVHTVDPNQPDKIDIKTVAREVVFGSQMIVMMSSKDVELDYATKDFATDTSISRFNGLAGEKELEPWEGDGDECNISLDNANGWDPNEMFARNEKVYGVQSSFEQDLSQYTCKLDRRDSLEFKEREAQAAMLASSIEGNASSKAQADLENCSDEEEKYSAVVRPDSRREPRDFRDFSNRATGTANAGWKYVHPNKRPTKSGMQSVGKIMRSTPPPHSNLAPRHQPVGSYYDGEGRGVHHGGYHQPFQGRGGQSGPYYGRSQGPPGGYKDTRVANGADKVVPAAKQKNFVAKTRDDQNTDLKKFGQDFRLALSETAAAAAPPVEEKKSTPSPTIPTKINTPPPVTPPISVAPSPVVSPVSTTPPVRQATPVQPEESLDKVSDTLKKSSLNPNAKEFVLNPNARVFIPTPPRSHTPQTQQGGGQILMPAPMAPLQGMGPSGSPGQVPLMPLHYVPAAPGGVQNQGPNQGNQPHYASHNPGAPRYRKPSPMPVNHRPDLASSMHVAAATGQPLMAPAPMGGPQLFYPPQGAMMSGQPQPYTQLYAMRLVGPQMQGMVPNSSYVESGTTGHGPIYMSPGHGQNNQGQMGPPQQQSHHHPNSAPSPAQQHSMAQTQAGNPPQMIYQTAGGHHGHNPGPPHSHHASFPMVFLPPGHSQLPPGQSGGPGGPQGVQLLPLGSSGMGVIPQFHYIQQGPGNQAVHRLV